MGLHHSRFLTFGQAVYDNNVEWARHLLSEEYDPLLNQHYAHLLALAAGFGYTEMVELLINSGYDVNRKDRYGNGALMAAVVRRRPLTANYLIERGAFVTDEIRNQAVKWGVDLIEIIWDLEVPISHTQVHIPPDFFSKVFWFIWGNRWRAAHARIREERLLALERAGVGKSVQQLLQEAQVSVVALQSLNNTAVWEAAASGADELLSIINDAQHTLEEGDAESLNVVLSKLTSAQDIATRSSIVLADEAKQAEKERVALLKAAETVLSEFCEAKDALDGIPSFSTVYAETVLEMDGWKQKDIRQWTATFIEEKRNTVVEVRAALSHIVSEGNMRKKVEEATLLAESHITAFSSLSSTCVAASAHSAAEELRAAIDAVLVASEAGDLDALNVSLRNLVAANEAASVAYSELVVTSERVIAERAVLVKEADAQLKELDTILAMLIDEKNVGLSLSVEQVKAAASDVVDWSASDVKEWSLAIIEERRRALHAFETLIGSSRKHVTSAIAAKHESVRLAAEEAAKQAAAAKAVDKSLASAKMIVSALQAMDGTSEATAAGLLVTKLESYVVKAVAALEGGATSDSLNHIVAQLDEVNRITNAKVFDLKEKSIAAEKERTAVMQAIDSIAKEVRGMEEKAVLGGIDVSSLLGPAVGMLEELDGWRAETMEQWSAPLLVAKRKLLGDALKLLSIAESDIDSALVAKKAEAMKRSEVATKVEKAMTGAQTLLESLECLAVSSEALTTSAAVRGVMHYAALALVADSTSESLEKVFGELVIITESASVALERMTSAARHGEMKRVAVLKGADERVPALGSARLQTSYYKYGNSIGEGGALLFSLLAIIALVAFFVRRKLHWLDRETANRTAAWNRAEKEAVPFRTHLQQLSEAARSDGTDQLTVFPQVMLDVARGDIDAVRIASLEPQFAVDMRTDFGLTLLMIASAFGHKKIVQLLCTWKVDPDTQLLAPWADSSLLTPDGSSALSLAAEKVNNSNVVSVLKNIDASSQVVLKNGMTLLMLSAKTGDAGSFEQFIKCEERNCIMIPSYDGRSRSKHDRRNLLEETALLVACKHGHEGLVENLIRDRPEEHGVPDVRACDVMGITALHHMAINGWRSLPMALLLINHGALVNAKDMHGKTPLDYTSPDVSEQTKAFLTQHNFSAGSN